MGAGVHGGFGSTAGAIRYRKGHPVEETPKDLDIVSVGLI